MTPEKGSSAVSDHSAPTGQNTALRLHGVRYQVADVSRAVAFYTTHLGFKLEHQPAILARAVPAWRRAQRQAQRLLSQDAVDTLRLVGGPAAHA